MTTRATENLIPTPNPYDILKAVKHPVPNKVYSLFGCNVIFSYSIIHLNLLAFTFTYLNVVTLAQFDVFSSLLTGNFVDATLDILDYRNDTVFKITLIICCSFFGTCMDCALLLLTQSRENTLCIILTMLIFSCLIVGSARSFSDDRYILLPQSLTSGALLHWSTKLGYTSYAFTGNAFKLAEIAFKSIMGESIGGPVGIGETIILTCMVLSSSVAGVLATTLFNKTTTIVLIYLPVIISFPFHAYYAGCFYTWGWLTAPVHHRKSEVQMSNTIRDDSPTSSAGDDFGRSSIISISTADAETLDAVKAYMETHDYKANKDMIY